MKTAMRTVVFALVAAFVAGCERTEVSDGNPFGLDLDKHPSEYGCVQVPNKKLFWEYRCDALPEPLAYMKPHPEIDRFEIQYVDGIGICNVEARGKPFSYGSFSGAVKKRGKAVARQLARKYGAHTTYRAFLNEHFFLWHERDGFKPVGDVSVLGAVASSPGGGTGVVKLVFGFKRNSKCQEFIKQQEG